MTGNPVKIILGAANVGDQSDVSTRFHTSEAAQELLNVFKKYGHTTIDTSRRYPPTAPGTSEAILGQTDIAHWAKIDTKALSGPGDHAPEKIAQSVEDSLRYLNIPRIHIEYLHFPDRTSPLEGVCEAMNDGLKKGNFEAWGISNYSIDEIHKIVEICHTNNYTKPAVYQGLYNPLARKAEEELIPLLRKHKIAFYAYSPAAGGVFSKSSSRAVAEGYVGDFFRKTYGKDSITSAISLVQGEVEKGDISGHEAALRWVLHHSMLRGELGDAIIVGASSARQLEKTLKACATGPLPEDLAKHIEKIWEIVHDSAPNFSPVA